jgi:HlyD family secretion protein
VLRSGQLQDIRIAVGDYVTASELLAAVDPLDGSALAQIVAPLNGQVVEVRSAPGALVQAGEPLVMLAPEGADLTALAYVPPDVAVRLRPGMTVKLAPSNVRTEEVGYLLGIIQSVSEFPSSPSGVAAAVGSAELAGALLQGQTPIAVKIALVRDPDAPSGYRWTSAHGPDVSLSGVTLSTMIVVVEQMRPLELVFKR